MNKAHPIQYPAQRGFTMIEIAISLGIIAFALVAIIGVLPLGLTVGKDNREDTIINQDSAYFMDVIRSGSKGADDLTNYVEWIAITNATIINPANSPIDSPTNLNHIMFTNYTYGAGDHGYTNGGNIVGLLSCPRYILDKDGIPTQVNFVMAGIRAMNGSALEQSTNNDPNNPMAFRYKLTVETVPFYTFSTDSTNWKYYVDQATKMTGGASSNVDVWLPSSNRWVEAGILRSNLYEVRLKFDWPLLNDPKNFGKQYRLPSGHSMLLRGMVSGQLNRENTLPYNHYFFQQGTFTNPPSS